MRRLIVLLSCLPLLASGQQAFRFVNANSGKVLDTPAAADGTILHQWDWVGGTNQEWQIDLLTDYQYKIVSVSNGRVLDVQGSSTADGAWIQMNDWLSTGSEQWQIVPQSSSYSSVVNYNSGKVLDVTALSTADGANIHQWDWVTGLNQQWQIEPIQTTYNRSAVTNIIYNSSVGLVNVTTTVDWDTTLNTTTLRTS